ncbi:MAG: SsrA-binding protein SmpB [Planctomycetes bacterium]|nr:SsrA-binding protein SmpB [Planctomycetota bacterium]
MAKKSPHQNVICQNRKAGFRFEILEKVECGLVLVGSEVKSLRDGNASIEEAYARIERGELWLIDSHVQTYDFAHASNHEPRRPRKLLIHKRELNKLRPQVEQKGLTLVPLYLYFNDRGLAKVTIGLARGKTRGDKRQAIKKREHKREMDRALRGRHR